MTKHFCYYHDDFDGLGAAYAVKVAYNGELFEFHPVNYGTDKYHLTEIEKSTVIVIVDFCPKPEDVVKLCTLAGKVLIIDHHKTSIADMEAYFANKAGLPNLEFVADVTVSGCELAWKHLLPEDECPTALAYIGDRDMWKFELPQSKELNAWIGAQPATLKDMVRIVEDLNGEGLGAFIDMGGAIMQSDQRYMEKMLKRLTFASLDGLSAAFVNSSHLASELGNFILTRPEFAQVDLAAIWSCDEGKLRVSLRSRKGSQIDVSAIAKKRGGGGHFNAAGYDMPFTINLS